MVLTIDYIKERFNKYNKLYFNGSLIEPSFKISKGKRVLGLMSWTQNFLGQKSYTISISKYYDRTEKQYDNTIIHEMIHLSIHQKKIRDNGSHGRYFKAECARINRDGWDLARTTDTRDWGISNEVADKIKSKKYDVFVYKTNGKQYIIRVSSNRIDTYKNYFLRKCIEFKYYQVSDRIFEEFPRNVNHFRGYYIDRKEEYKKYMIL